MFTPEKISLLLDPASPRRIISSLNAGDTSPVSDETMLEWHRNNSNRHNFQEAMLCLEGTVYQALNGQVYRMAPGTLFLIDSNEIHDDGYSPYCSEGSHIWLTFMQNSVNIVGDELRDGIFSVNLRFFYHNQQLPQYLKQLWKDAVQGKIRKDAGLSAINSIINLIFAEMVQKLDNGNDTAVPDLGNISHQQQVVDSIKDYLDANHGRNSDIETLAKMAGYSRPHFLRLFRQYARCNVGEYVNLRRYERYFELSRRKILLKEIAEELGFSSSEALLHWRKRYFPDSKT